jgi:hypothetical protein
MADRCTEKQLTHSKKTCICRFRQCLLWCETCFFVSHCTKHPSTKKRQFCILTCSQCGHQDPDLSQVEKVCPMCQAQNESELECLCWSCRLLGKQSEKRESSRGNNKTQVHLINYGLLQTATDCGVMKLRIYSNLMSAKFMTQEQALRVKEWNTLLQRGSFPRGGDVVVPRESYLLQ